MQILLAERYREITKAGYSLAISWAVERSKARVTLGQVFWHSRGLGEKSDYAVYQRQTKYPLIKDRPIPLGGED